MTRRLLNTLPLTLLLLAAAFKARVVHAEEVHGSVVQMSGNTLYLSVGKARGLSAGQAGEVRRSGARIARIEIISVAEQSSSSRVIEQTSPPQIGDEAVFTMRDSVAAAPALPNTPLKPEHATVENQIRQRRKSAHRISGRIGLQFYAQDDRTSLNYDYSQPAVVVRLNAPNLFGSHYSVSIRLRSRRNFWPETAQSSKRDWDNRVYEAALRYSDPESPWEYQAGRILPGPVSGIGYMDGVFGKFSLSKNIAVGAFGGTKPNLQTTEFQTRTTQGGGFVMLKSGRANTAELNVVGALAGEYTDGEISREFIYQQTSLNWGTRFSVYQSAEINVNRGWKREAERESLKIANMIANARWMIFENVAVSAGYDGFANYRTWENHDTPDSLFDEALRQGYRLGLEFGLPFGIHADVRGTLRDEAHASKLQQSGSVSAMTHSLIGGRLGLGARYNTFENRFTRGQQPSGSISFTVWNGAELSLQGGRTSYHYLQTAQDTDTDWFRGSLDFGIGRRFYSTISGEVYRGDSENAFRTFIETGVRL